MLLDGKRSMNINIFLRQFKGYVTYSGIYASDFDVW